MSHFQCDDPISAQPSNSPLMALYNKLQTELGRISLITPIIIKKI
uniref:Uncharacterized protein n=1 Tax=Anguilla anguilla TaxID=7936 RepID=A0A0E9V7Y0_ANGAN